MKLPALLKNNKKGTKVADASAAPVKSEEKEVIASNLSKDDSTDEESEENQALNETKAERERGSFDEEGAVSSSEKQANEEKSSMKQTTDVSEGNCTHNAVMFIGEQIHHGVEDILHIFGACTDHGAGSSTPISSNLRAAQAAH